MAAVEIGPVEVRTVDAQSRTLDSVPYTSGTDAVVALLTVAFGGPPVAGHADTECIAPATATWVWGGTVDDPFHDTVTVLTPQPALIPGQATWIRSTAARVGDVAVRAEDGLAVGDPLEQAIPRLDPQQLAGLQPSAAEGGGRGFVFATAGSIDVDGMSTLYGVAALEEGGSGIVASIGAPRTANRQGC